MRRNHLINGLLLTIGWLCTVLLPVLDRHDTGGSLMLGTVAYLFVATGAYILGRDDERIRRRGA